MGSLCMMYVSFSGSHVALHKMINISAKTLPSQGDRSLCCPRKTKLTPDAKLLSSPGLHSFSSALSITLPYSLTNASLLFPANTAPEGRAGTAWKRLIFSFCLGIENELPLPARTRTHTHHHHGIISVFVLLVRFN
jgi:hypothetical protein